MSGCDALVTGASAGIAPALRAVDCMAGEITASAFGRLFGAQGALAPALTILLTLYIAFFAVSLLTGRSTLGISALTPRMMTLGLVLTFATSWIAYQGVLWNLAAGAPDQIAAVLTGTHGSATALFADRIDMIFGAIAQAGELAGGQAGGQGGAAGQVASGSFTPANLMWLSGLFLLLGTVGILVTARIALAVLLAVGPVFVVLALFQGTRGLTAGWLRGVAMTALTPLFVVVGGGITVEMLVPVIAGLVGEEGINGRAAMALFLIASVHFALMVMLLRVSATMVSAWNVFGLARGELKQSGNAFSRTASVPAALAVASQVEPGAERSSRTRGTLIASLNSSAVATQATAVHRERSIIQAGIAPSTHAPLPQSRARGVGSRFRSPQPRPVKVHQ